MRSSQELRELVRARFQYEEESEPLIAEAIRRGANIDGLCLSTEEAFDFESWKFEISDWIEWLRGE